MLTKKQIVDLRALSASVRSAFANYLDGSGHQAKELAEQMAVALDEIEAERPVVLAALVCTGEDGHDGTVSLVCAAEEYLDKIAAADPKWRSQYGCAAIDRAVY
jgi:hypothetical protein